MKRRRIILVLTVVFVNGMQIACHQPSHHARQSSVVLPNAMPFRRVRADVVRRRRETRRRYPVACDH